MDPNLPSSICDAQPGQRLGDVGLDHQGTSMLDVEIWTSKAQGFFKRAPLSSSMGAWRPDCTCSKLPAIWSNDLLDCQIRHSEQRNRGGVPARPFCWCGLCPCRHPVPSIWPSFQDIAFPSRPDMVAQSFGIVHVHGFSDAQCNVDSWGPKVVKGVWDEPFVVTGDVGVFVLQGHGHNGETFLRAGVKHAELIRAIQAFVRGAFRENHVPIPSSRRCRTAERVGSPAVLLFAVHPNGAVTSLIQ